MKAIRFNQYGGSNVMCMVEIDPSHAGPGEVRIKVRATGVNPSDWKRREGQYRTIEDIDFPAGVGVEAAGLVDEVGSGVTGVTFGDAVFGYGDGTAAEYAVLTHWVRKPEAVSFEVAGSLPVAGETAWRCLDEVGVRAGQTLLVCGAAGGIGSAVLQLAHERQIRVIGTASAVKHDYLRALGAIPTTYEPGLVARVHVLAPEGVHAALDLAGAGIIPELIAIVGTPERVLSVTDFSAEAQGAKFSHGPPNEPERVLAELARLCAEGRFHVHIEQTFPLAQTAQAHDLSASKTVTGKLVLTCDEATSRP